ncbi:MAG: response regulator [Bacteroidetes bacterium]|nr:response regulator [Bacteroidota bacterium]
MSFRQISDSAKTLAQPNPKPVHLSQLLTSLSEAESHLRAFSLTQNKTYLKSYERNTNEVFKQLNTLKRLNEGKLWELRLDTLSLLITRKVEGLNEFTILRNQLDKQTFTAKALKRLNQSADQPVSVSTKLKTTEKEIRRNLPPVPTVQMQDVEKKGLLNKIFGKNKKEPVIILPDSNLVTTTKEVSVDTIILAQPISDSLISSMRKILKELQLEESSNRRQLSQQELSLLAFDQVVMEEIRRVINLMEQEEETESTERIIGAQRMVDEASLIIFLISLTGLVTSFIFVTLVIRDISRSNFYKEQLERARSKEAQLRQVKEQFLANMSHEIRTPLNAIVGFSEQLHQQKLPPQQHKQVEAIRHSSDFLLATVNDILDMSKIEAGQIRFEKLDFDLLHLVQRTADLIQNRALDKKLNFITDLPVAPAYLKGDPFRLQQILYNLLGNAIKFTDSGDVKLKCRARDNGFGKYVVDITVSDSGIGIPTEKLSQIFDSFTQADPSITRRYGGSGLGLAITKKLIDLQGGEISVRSRPGKGTVFYVCIPYVKGQPVEQPVTSTKLAHIPADWKAKKILVVDDDPLNVLLLQTILKKWQIPTEVAESGQDALQKLGEMPIDLVLTDMNMPGMSGLQLLYKIRQSTGLNEQVPVVAVTANALQQDLNQYLAQGMSAYLVKPFQESELIQLLASFWEQQEAAEGMDAATAEQKTPQPASPDRDFVLTSEQQPKINSQAGNQYSLHIYHKYAAGDRDSLRLMLETFLSNTKENLRLMEQYSQQENWPELKELAHKMYPSFKQLQAEEAARLLRRMELEADATDQQRKIWISQFLEEGDQVVEFVKAELQETVASANS